MQKVKLALLLSIGYATNIFSQPFSIDPAFVVNYPFNSLSGVTGILEEPDGSFAIYGQIPEHMVKFLSNGNIDYNFQLFPPVAVIGPSNVQRTSYGYFAPTELRLRKIDFNTGALADTPYFYNQLNVNNPLYYPASFSSLSSGVLDKNGKFWAGCGDFSMPCNWPSSSNPILSYFLYRVDSTGWFDTTFTHQTNGGVMGVSKYNDSLLFVQGKFTEYDNYPINRIVRIDLDGNIDSSFTSIFYPWIGGPGLQGGGIYPIYIQPDGKIIVMGYFNIVGYPLNIYQLVRLNIDGSLDTTFNYTALINQMGESVGTICPTSDGGYLMGGNFKNFQGYNRGHIVKTDSNGFIDTAYFNGTGFEDLASPQSSGIMSISQGLNDTYYVTGFFDTYDGQSVDPIIRLAGLTVSINEDEFSELNIKVYPNPANQSFKIMVNSEFKTADFKLYDLFGKMIREELIKNPVSPIDVSDLMAGVYFMTINIPERILVTKKIVIHR